MLFPSHDCERGRRVNLSCCWTCVVLVAVLSSSLAALADSVTVRPAEDESAVLQNPDMGWVLYENYPVDPAPGGSSTMVTLPDESFPGVAEVAIMFSWFDIEKQEGDYDFSAVDRAYDYWKARGKRIQLRMSTTTLLWWDHVDPPRGKGPPDYVVNRLAEARKQLRTGTELPPYTVVDARDPFYLERLARFLAAVAAHYTGERAVTLVDLRGFGVWGEWHSGFKYATVDDRRDALIGVIDRYADAFKDSFLSLSYSYDPDGPESLHAGPTDRYSEAHTKTYDAYLNYSAFDHALTKANVTFRRDGCGGAVHSNERRLCEQAFATLAKGPFMCEFIGGYAEAKGGDAGWIAWKIEDALSLHPNYINLLGYQGGDALAFLCERPDLVAHGLCTMGYRLVPVGLTYSSRVSTARSFEVTSEWVNRGVGRAMRDYSLRLDLVDESGKTAASVDTGPAGTDKWVKGKSYVVRRDVRFEGVPPGRYVLHLALVDPKIGRPIELPLKDGRPDGAYPAGAIEVGE